MRDFDCFRHYIVDEGFAEFFEFFDLDVDDLVDLGGFSVEVVGDRFLFAAGHPVSMVNPLRVPSVST